MAAIALAAGVAAGAAGTGIAGASNGDRTHDVRAAVKGARRATSSC
ncbi:hypothetical protein ACFQHO_23040 [Actinomadura yumaensis]